MRLHGIRGVPEVIEREFVKDFVEVRTVEQEPQMQSDKLAKDSKMQKLKQEDYEKFMADSAEKWASDSKVEAHCEPELDKVEDDLKELEHQKEILIKASASTMETNATEKVNMSSRSPKWTPCPSSW